MYKAPLPDEGLRNPTPQSTRIVDSTPTTSQPSSIDTWKKAWIAALKPKTKVPIEATVTSATRV